MTFSTRLALHVSTDMGTQPAKRREGQPVAGSLMASAPTYCATSHSPGTKTSSDMESAPLRPATTDAAEEECCQWTGAPQNGDVPAHKSEQIGEPPELCGGSGGDRGEGACRHPAGSR